MSNEKTEVKKRKVAWGISGAGDKIQEFVQVMEEISKDFADKVEIQVFVSKAAEIVLKYYQLEENLKRVFPKVAIEINSNTPFLAASMQTHKYEFLLIAPASSNTTAKVALGIGDTMLTNAASMSLKAFVPVYMVPTDFEEKTVYTKLPNGKDMKLRIRKEDAENVRRLERMEDVHVLSEPQKIREVFKEWFGQT
ncbi:MAG TPA: archaeoflavoprotein AfpA [Candidatus Nanoarchaeia archaeon]|nr:archaeoflavoprotein AfpA [Candidatus Nanoarchaeia archaeon]